MASAAKCWNRGDHEPHRTRFGQYGNEAAIIALCVPIAANNSVSLDISGLRHSQRASERMANRRVCEAIKDVTAALDRLRDFIVSEDIVVSDNYSIVDASGYAVLQMDLGR